MASLLCSVEKVIPWSPKLCVLDNGICTMWFCWQNRLQMELQLGAVHKVQCCPKNETLHHFCQTPPLPLKRILSGGEEKYDIDSDPLPRLWDEFRSSGNIELYERPLIVPGPGEFYLPRNETSYDPMHFDLEVIWRSKPIFVRNHFLGSRRPLNEIPQVGCLSRSGVNKSVLQNGLIEEKTQK